MTAEERPALSHADHDSTRAYIALEAARPDRRARLLRKMTDSRAALFAAFDRLDSANASVPTHNEGWTARDVAAHISGAEAGMLGLIVRAKDGITTPVSPDFDVNFYNKRGIEKRQAKTLDDLRAELTASRVKALALLDTLSDDDLLKPSHHPTLDETTIYGVFVAIYSHERQHAADIVKALDAEVV